MPTPLDAPTRPERSTRRRRIALSVTTIAAVLSGASALTSEALFTASSSVTSPTFSNGKLDISTNKTATAISMTNMAPGDVVYAPLTITNAGNLPAHYSMTSTASGSLAQYLTMAIRSGVTSCTATGWSATGSGVRNAAGIGTATAVALFGSSDQGAQTGDRTLAVGDSETLCFRVELASTRGTEVMGLTANMTLNAYATHTLSS